MRRPDLPLILIVLAGGAALAVFAEERPPPGGPAPPGAPADAPDVVDDFFEDFDPVFVDCFGDVEPAGSREVADRPPKALVASVSERMEQVRGLRFADDVDARFLEAGELRRKVEGLVARELPEAELRREEEVLKALGALAADADLEEITTQALGSQVAGLYDTRTRDLLVQSADEINAEELVTLAHELDHALVDQALGIRERAGGRDEVDRQLAYAALVEGDATLAMELYALRYVDLGDQLELGESVPGEREFEALPDYVQRSLLFPYLEGLRFVCHRYAEGGWEEVDRVYDDPPAATSQVIFPDRYGVIEPFDAELPPRPGPGWTSVTSRELGAAELEWLFRAPGGDPAASLPDPRGAVFGWAGGAVELWERREERALAISLVQLPRTNSLCGAMDAWYRAAWSPEEAESRRGGGEFSSSGRVAELSCEGVEVRVGIGPDRATAARLAG